MSGSPIVFGRPSSAVTIFGWTITLAPYKFLHTANPLRTDSIQFPQAVSPGTAQKYQMDWLGGFPTTRIACVPAPYLNIRYRPESVLHRHPWECFGR